MTQIYFLTFGGPSQDYHMASARICQQASKMDIFDKIICFNETDLMNDDDFWQKHSSFILSNPRGYGYWLWKPYIIKKTLDTMNENDILLYCDCGNELNNHPIAKQKLQEYIELVKDKNILGTKGGSSDYNYTKMDLIKYFKMENKIQLLSQPHMQATVLMIKNNHSMREFMKEYYEIGSQNYHFIDDSPSIYINFSCFVEHRHDQSIFSLLAKKYNYLNYDLDPTYWGVFTDGLRIKHNYLENAIEYPIWTCRNKTGISVIDIVE